MWKIKDKKRILAFVKQAQEDLNLQSWTIMHQFNEKDIKGISRISDTYFFTAAENAVTQEYEKICIDWYPILLTSSEEQIKESVYHELIHSLTQELFELSLNRCVTQDQCIRTNERLIQRITKICLKKSTNQK